MDDLTAGLCALALCTLYKGVQKLRETRTIYISPQVPPPESRNVREHNNQQADNTGWALTITQISVTRYDCSFAIDANDYNELEVRVISTSILLNWLRDNHPNPDVADKSSDLILTLGTTARTID